MAGGLALSPAAASAHGPVDPAASSYLARIDRAPAGVDARMIDGDQRLWIAVDPRLTVTVRDYLGAPYLRFTPAGVQVNENSAMYYLNQVPPETPPLGLSAGTAPYWTAVSAGHAYGWHDGRLHALAAVALLPGASFMGRWRIPLTVGGAPAAITGGLYFAPSPSIVWFWPILVVLGCVLAALRLGRPALDTRLARGLAATGLVAFGVAAAGQQLHGRPTVSVGQLIMLALSLAFVAWGARRLVLGRHGWFTFFLIAAVAIWEGGSMIAVLLDGWVLLALPPVVARLAVTACLATGLGLLPIVWAMAERPSRARARTGRGRRGPADVGDAAAALAPDPAPEPESAEAWRT